MTAVLPGQFEVFVWVSVIMGFIRISLHCDRLPFDYFKKLPLPYKRIAPLICKFRSSKPTLISVQLCNQQSCIAIIWHRIISTMRIGNSIVVLLLFYDSASSRYQLILSGMSHTPHICSPSVLVSMNIDRLEAP